MRDWAWRNPASACCSLASAWSSRNFASRSSRRAITCPCWTKSPTSTGVSITVPPVSGATSEVSFATKLPVTRTDASTGRFSAGATPTVRAAPAGPAAAPGLSASVVFGPLQLIENAMSSAESKAPAAVQPTVLRTGALFLAERLGRGMSPLPVLLVSTQTGGRRFGESTQNKSNQLLHRVFVRDRGLFSPENIFAGGAMHYGSHRKSEYQIGVARAKRPF